MLKRIHFRGGLLLALLAVAFTAQADKYLGDYATSSVVYGKFTTYRPSTGAAFTLGGTPALSVYKDNSTTQSTTGVTLTADFDAVTGLNHFAIDTSTDGTFYSAGSNFDVVITTGTVDSVSVVGTVVASFSLAKTSALRPATAGRTVVVDAAGLVDANMVKAGPSGSGTAQTARDIGGAVPAAAAGASGGLLISGSNSGTTTLGALTVTGTTTLSDGLVVARSTSNQPAATFTGNGTGNGITIASGSGATGTGLAISSAATNGTAMTLAGAGTGNGLTATGGATGHGISGVGGATSGNGIRAVGTAGNSAAMNLVGQGSAAGLLSTGGATGAGVSAVGGATSGAGIAVTASAGNSTALTVTGQGTGNGATFTSGSGATGNGVQFTAASTNGSGLGLTKTGTGSGITGTVDATFSGSILDSTMSGHTTGGTVGGALNSASSAGDPWSTALPGAYTAGSAGYIVGNVLTLNNMGVLTSGTAQTGSTGTTLVLASSTDFTANDRIKGATCAIVSGTGAGESLTVASYVNSTDTATMNGTWPTTPDNTSVYVCYRTPYGSSLSSSDVTAAVWDATRSGHVTSGTFGEYVPANITTIGGSALSTSTAQLGVNVVNFGGAAGTFSGGRPEVNTARIGGQTVTASGGITFPAATLASTTNITSATGITVSTNSDKTGYTLSSAGINAIADQSTTGHTTAGTWGGAWNAAGSAGDPWTTNLPGAYGAGTAGYLIGTYIDAAISSRLAPTVASRTLDVTATGAAGIDWGNVENATTTVGLSGTTVGTATTLTNKTGFSISGTKTTLDALNDLSQANVRTAVGLATANLDTQLTTIDDYVDTEVAAIKAKTDSLTFTVAGQVDSNVQSVNDVTITGDGSGTPFNVATYRQWKQAHPGAQMTRALFRELRDRAIREFAQQHRFIEASAR